MAGNLPENSFVARKFLCCQKISLGVFLILAFKAPHKSKFQYMLSLTPAISEKGVSCMKKRKSYEEKRTNDQTSKSQKASKAVLPQRYFTKHQRSRIAGQKRGRERVEVSTG